MGSTRFEMDHQKTCQSVLKAFVFVIIVLWVLHFFGIAGGKLGNRFFDNRPVRRFYIKNIAARHGLKDFYLARLFL